MKIILSIILIFFISSRIFSQNFYGVSGYIRTPDSRTVPFKAANFGASIVHDSKYIGEGDMHLSTGEHFVYALGIYAAAGVLPGLEISLRHGRQLDREGLEIYSGRTMSIKWNPIDESEKYPAFAVGIQDLLGGSCCRDFNSLYFTASKNFKTGKQIQTYATVGLGTNLWTKITGYAYQKIKGFFGAFETNFTPYFSVMGEYDSQFFNSGVKYNFKNFITLRVLTTQFKYYGVMTDIKFSL
ncbi:MAG: YjbH domain-containing protein [Bacteroidetes bacterium]|nr:YjbH domain-containing protein [Bacteroidota bacterium]